MFLTLAELCLFLGERGERQLFHPYTYWSGHILTLAVTFAETLASVSLRR